MKRLVVGASLAHLAVQLVLAFEPRLFASEDDGYRVYQAFLMCSGQADLVGRFWLPGPMALACAPQAAGVSAASAGVLVSLLSLAVLAGALRAIARRLGGPEAGQAALVLVLVSPLAVVLSRSALAELPSLAGCALGGLALLARARGGSRWVLAGGALALLVATWMRYESWLLAAAYPLLAGALSFRRARAWFADAAVAALACLGPLVWMLLQWQRFGDPFTFLRATGEITAQAGHAGAFSVVSARLVALATWAPAVLLWALAGRRVDRTPRAWALGFAAWMALGVLVPALLGDEHPVFPDRLAFGLEVGLLPLAALALARRPRWTFGVLTVLPLGLALLREPVYLDADSVRVGLELRAGRITPAGRLLVERPELRPPLGWASLASAWGAWERIVFATPRDGDWQLVQPIDVQQARFEVADPALATWLAEHQVTDAWCSTAACATRMGAVWPAGSARRFGRGVWITARGEGPSTPR